jgi:hypothetical protein
VVADAGVALGRQLVARVEVVKNSRTASSSQAGALATSTTTPAPAITRARPSPVMVSTPVSGEAGTASCPRA